MDLADRGRGEGVLVEVGEHARQRAAELLAHQLLEVGERHRRDVVAQRAPAAAAARPARPRQGRRTRPSRSSGRPSSPRRASGRAGRRAGPTSAAVRSLWAAAARSGDPHPVGGPHPGPAQTLAGHQPADPRGSGEPAGGQLARLRRRIVGRGSHRPRLTARRSRPRAAKRYAGWMEPARPGDRVTVASGGPVLDGIVFDTPSDTKVVVAVVDPGRGPVFRTVHPSTLSEREQDGPADRALRFLVRRTPAPVPAAARGGGSGGRGRAAHTRSATHRPTGR